MVYLLGLKYMHARGRQGSRKRMTRGIASIDLIIEDGRNAPLLHSILMPAHFRDAQTEFYAIRGAQSRPDHHDALEVYVQRRRTHTFKLMMDRFQISNWQPELSNSMSDANGKNVRKSFPAQSVIQKAVSWPFVKDYTCEQQNLKQWKFLRENFQSCTHVNFPKTLLDFKLRWSM